MIPLQHDISVLPSTIEKFQQTDKVEIDGIDMIEQYMRRIAIDLEDESTILEDDDDESTQWVEDEGDDDSTCSYHTTTTTLNDKKDHRHHLQLPNALRPYDIQRPPARTQPSSDESLFAIERNRIESWDDLDDLVSLDSLGDARKRGIHEWTPPKEVTTGTR